MSISHWMTFGTFAEQSYFIYPRKDAYDGVIINANMAAYAPAGLATFLLEKTAGLRYIIDPMTHAFQHDPSAIAGSNNEPKTSIATLAEAYGEWLGPGQGVLGVRPVRPTDFADNAILSDFVSNCLYFQKHQLADAMAKSDASKYLSVADASPLPFGLVAPYFYLTEVGLSDWLPVCRDCIELALAEEPGQRVFAAVVVGQGVILNEKLVEKIVKTFGGLAVAGYLLWVDGLDEHEAGSQELRALLELARALRGNGDKEVINLHGGYFSVLAAGTLGKSAMSGVSHGPEFGELRSVVPVGGGIPVSRYYIPLLHSRIRFREAARLLQGKGWLDSATVFHGEVCDCRECKATLDGDAGNFVLFGVGTPREVRRGRGVVRIEYPTGETKKHCLKHYLERKRREFQLAAGPEADILSDLDKGIREFQDVGGLGAVSHLMLWKGVLTS